MSASMIRAVSDQAAAHSLLKTLEYESDAFYELESEVVREFAQDEEMTFEEYQDAYGSPEIHEWPQEKIDRLIEALQVEVREAGVEPQPYPVHEGFQPNELRSIPNLGSLRPGGYDLAETLFVDKSGFGAPDEPALTFGQFVGEVQRCIREHGSPVYLALIEEGQFQVYVGVFLKDQLDFEHITTGEGWTG